MGLGFRNPGHKTFTPSAISYALGQSLDLLETGCSQSQITISIQSYNAFRLFFFFMAIRQYITRAIKVIIPFD